MPAQTATSFKNAKTTVFVIRRVPPHAWHAYMHDSMRSQLGFFPFSCPSCGFWELFWLLLPPPCTAVGCVVEFPCDH